ncbi:MAG: protein kinase [Verrucomicrobiales bacterium]|nr:protein kinase [Verrucomicrobiales bacterium]
MTRLLGSGGMGAVYEAIQTSLNRKVAIKILSTQLNDAPEFAARFRREAHSMAQLNHPGIIQVHDFGETDSGLCFLVMEYVDGSNLHELIHNNALDPETAVEMAARICEALDYAHEKGLIHRDIKPGNIMVSRDGTIKICDFGLAKLLRTENQSAFDSLDVTKSGLFIATPHYVAPERIDDDSKTDHRADLYSLGVMFYEMLTGEIPRGSFDLPSKKAKVAARFDNIVAKALKVKPDDRYQSANEMKKAITARGIPPLAGWSLLILLLFTTISFSFVTYGKITGEDADFNPDLVPPTQWNSTTVVSDLLLFLGEPVPDHYQLPADDTLIETGRTLVTKGQLRDKSGAATPRLSPYFTCADCHNSVREEPDLRSISDPDVKLRYAIENDIPLLQATTFAGMVNRESWYNDDYAKKYRFSPRVRAARNYLKAAIELCCSECAQGRRPELWEMEALLAYFWSLQWKLGDLDITNEILADWKRRAVVDTDHSELVTEIKSHYALQSPATFGEPPTDAKEGFSIDTTPDPQTGKQVFVQSCLHCHDPAEGAAEHYFRDNEESRRELARKFRSNAKKSVYGHIRLGTHPEEGQRLYMPNYTLERLSDYQIESLRAYLEGVD